MGLLPLVFLGAMGFVNSDYQSRQLIPLPDASLAVARPEGGRAHSEMLSNRLADGIAGRVLRANMPKITHKEAMAQAEMRRKAMEAARTITHNLQKRGTPKSAS